MLGGVVLGGVYLSGHPQSVTHLHLTADPAAWTRHPPHLYLALLHIHHTVVPIQHTHTHCIHHYTLGVGQNINMKYSL